MACDASAAKRGLEAALRFLITELIVFLAHGDKNMWLTDHYGDDLKEAFSEIESGSDRSVAIVCSAYVEDQLTAALKSKMEDDEVVLREMFRSSGPLGSFSAKINIGYLFRLYEKEVKRELDTIKEIRNSFAHIAKTRTFDSQRIRDLANNLTMSQRLDIYWKGRPNSVPLTEIKKGDEVIFGIGLRYAGNDESGPSILPSITSGAPLSPKQKYTRACQFHIGLLFMITVKGGPADVSGAAP